MAHPLANWIMQWCWPSLCTIWPISPEQEVLQSSYIVEIFLRMQLTPHFHAEGSGHTGQLQWSCLTVGFNIYSD